MKSLTPKPVLFLLTVIFFLVLTGFNLENAIVPREEIRSGGVPKDGIPAILNPKFVPPEGAAFLEPEDEVIGLEIGDESRAYPIKILNWHEAVNDRVGDRPVLITF